MKEMIDSLDETFRMFWIFAMVAEVASCVFGIRKWGYTSAHVIVARGRLGGEAGGEKLL